MRRIDISFRDLIWALISIGALLALLAHLGSIDRRTCMNDIEQLDALLDKFEEAYSGQLTNELRPLFMSTAVIAYDVDQGYRQSAHSLEDWLQGTDEDVFGANDHISDMLSDREIVVYRNIAYAVCDYTYIDDDQTSKGVDIFTFLKLRNRWRIVSLQWTGDTMQ